MRFEHRGKLIGIDSPFGLSEDRMTMYPGFCPNGVVGDNFANLRNLTPEHRAALGFTEVAEAAPVDGRFYFVSGDGPAQPRPVNQVRAMHIGNVKAFAGSLILERYPTFKQMNALARSVELTGIGQANWSPGEQAEAAALMAVRNWIKSVRDHSDALEAEINAADFETLVGWTAHDWPE